MSDLAKEVEIEETEVVGQEGLEVSTEVTPDSEALTEMEKILNPDEDEITSDSDEDELVEDENADDNSSIESDDGETQEVESETVEEEETMQDAVSDELLGIAVKHGISVTEANTLGQKRLVNILNQVIVEGEEPKTEEKKFSLGLTEEQLESIDEDVAQGLKSAESQIQSVLDANKELRDELNGLKAQASQESQSKVFSQFDSIVNSFPEKELFGENVPHKGTPEWDNRNKLFNEMSILHAGYKQIGEQVPPMEEMVKKAKALAFPEDLAKLARNELKTKVKKRETQTLLKPSDSATASKEDVEKGVIAKMKALLGGKKT